MASLLERMNMSGPVRPRHASASANRSAASAPYPKGNPDARWSHDLFDSHNSLSARLNVAPTPPKPTISSIAQKAIKDATASSLSIKGAGAGPSSSSQGNVVEVSGLVTGTTPDDVAAIFKRCGQISAHRSVSNRGEDPRIRLTFKSPSSAASAVQKFNNQPADGKILSVKIVGNSAAGSSLGGRLGGPDGLDLVREERSVDVLMETEDDTRSKLRSDSLLKADPRAHILVAPPGVDPADYWPAPSAGNPRRGRGRGQKRGGKRGTGGGIAARMQLD